MKNDKVSYILNEMLRCVALNIVIHEALRKCAFAITIQWRNTVESISVFMFSFDFKRCLQLFLYCNLF